VTFKKHLRSFGFISVALNSVSTGNIPVYTGTSYIAIEYRCLLLLRSERRVYIYKLLKSDTEANLQGLELDCLPKGHPAVLLVSLH
jgi:hypothetical protein